VNKPSFTAALCAIAIITTAPALLAGDWRPLKDDGLHDAKNPAVKVLQQPEEALSVLAPDTAGNQVDWVQAIRLGQIKPRSRVDGDHKIEMRDTEIIMRNTLSLYPVTFPHRAHTEWMSCAMCHESLFVSEEGANDITMSKILNGEYGGLCHGAVSFPLTECNRCHNVRPKTPLAPASSGTRTPDP